MVDWLAAKPRPDAVPYCLADLDLFMFAKLAISLVSSHGHINLDFLLSFTKV